MDLEELMASADWHWFNLELPLYAPVRSGAESPDTNRDVESEPVVAVRLAGKTIDFLLSTGRDIIAARAFLQLAIAHAGRFSHES
jgi:hypothetical protein